MGTGRSKRSIMNKLLLLGLISACLIVITQGTEQVEEKNVANLDAEVAALREAREADPKKKNGNKKAKKGRKGGKKARKGKKGSKKARKGKKKSKKGKRKSKKVSKKGKKGKRKSKKVSTK